MEERDAQQPKKIYKKPELRRVLLRPEEAVLGTCKTSGSGGPVGGDCGVSVCSSVGS
jgi:hypothetical protein